MCDENVKVKYLKQIFIYNNTITTICNSILLFCLLVPKLYLHLYLHSEIEYIQILPHTIYSVVQLIIRPSVRPTLGIMTQMSNTNHWQIIYKHCNANDKLNMKMYFSQYSDDLFQNRSIIIAHYGECFNRLYWKIYTVQQK